MVDTLQGDRLELNVIIVLGMADTLQGDYLDECRYIQSEQHWSKNGSLRHIVAAVKDGRLLLTDSNRLLASDTTIP